MTAVLVARQLAFGHAGRRLGDAVLCLLGPNGCGKTTLFRTLLGLLPRLGGEVHIEGQALNELSRSALARRVAYVPQAHAGAFAYAVEDMGFWAAPHACRRLRCRRSKTAAWRMKRWNGWASQRCAGAPSPSSAAVNASWC